MPLLTLFVLAGVSLASGCTRAIANFDRNLCVKDAVAVRSAWDGQIHRVFGRLWAVVASDLPGTDVTIVAVDGPPTLRTAWACGDARRNTIAFTVRALGRLNTFPAPEALVAITVAHELAHVVLHRGMSREGSSDGEEVEADTLGVYYYEHAGYDCRRWLRGEGYTYTDARLRAVESACTDVKRGVRPIVGPR